jgi:hypothetical protein
MPSQSIKSPLYEVPVASTSFLREAVWEGATQSIVFTYDAASDDNVLTRTRVTHIRFRRPMLLVERAESFCTVEHIEGCYDTLVEIQDSTLLLQHREHIVKARSKEAHHYMIYLDGRNFELIAEGWTADDLPHAKGVAQ